MGATRDGLTAKQLHFCRCVAAGMNQTEAYREAFDVSANSKRATHSTKASLLMKKVQIRQKVKALISQREAAMQASALSDREKVLRKLREWTESAEPTDSNKIRAAELLGKSVGLFKDVVETNDSKSSGDLISELEAVLEGVPAPESLSADVSSDESMH